MALLFRAIQIRKSRAMRGFLVWWAHTDLNRGPKDYESCQIAFPKHPETLIEYGL